jgi:RimJ/RimL family protein N-acetyltransferase
LYARADRILRGVDVLTTRRLRLRKLMPDDTDRLLEVLGDPEAMRFYPAPKSRLEVEGWIAWALESYAANGFGLWAIERIEDGAFLGDCGPMLQPVGDAVLPEIGYHLLRREWGRGYATEAAAAALAWVFRETDHPRACSIVSPANEASRRVAARIHRQLEMVTWARTGTEMCLYTTTRDQLGQPVLVDQARGPDPRPAG